MYETFNDALEFVAKPKTTDANNSQIEISFFTNDRLNVKPSGSYTIEKLYQRIRGNRWTMDRALKNDFLSNLGDSEGSEQHSLYFDAGYRIAVTFSGFYTSSRQTKHLKKHSGLICMSFKSAPYVRKTSLFENLKADPFSHILFRTPYDDGLKVVVKYKYSQPEDHLTCFNYLVDYYQKRYDVDDIEFDLDSQDINQLCYLPYDPRIYYEPNSERIDLPVCNGSASDSVTIIHTEKPVQEYTSNNLITVETSFEKKHEINSDEQETTKLWESLLYLSEWYDSNFASTDSKNPDMDTSVQIDLKQNKATRNRYTINFSKRRNNKKRDIANFQYDTATKSITSFDSKQTASKANVDRKKVTIESISNCLVDLLKDQTLELGQVYDLLEKHLKCSNKTVRNAIKSLLTDQSLLYKTTGKQVKLVKRQDGKKYFLCIENY